MLLWVLIRKILKDVSCMPMKHFKSVTEMMLAGDVGQGEALGKIMRWWIGVSRGLGQGSQAAHLMPSFLQFTSKACIESATPASSQFHIEPISPCNQAACLTLSVWIPLPQWALTWGSHLISSLGKEARPLCCKVLAILPSMVKGNISHSFARNPLPRNVNTINFSTSLSWNWF